ncbi:MAG TPA: hypothetical protein VM577_14090 [Anaerovoracaceae bacterium]|nr:hypothetical protein [Anaerovoracaceae bacterium]
MSNVGYDTFFTKRPSTRFVVKNVTDEHPKWAPKGKRVRVFAYPINVGETRDLLAIPGVSEADIRHALLKGELQIKLDPNIRELIVVDSDIDLLQFNDDQKAFLQSTGITKGLETTSGGSITPDQHETLRQLIHLADGVGGPMEGFASGSYRETLPMDDPFPTSIIWWSSISKINKIVEKTLSYDSSKRITVTSWKVYDESSILLATITDTFAYNGSSPFESSRTRVVS